ncbi:glycoside hydrolase family 16 protein [Artomyces pyxidatus]|uniref:Glycoside hydrolase family 16 protein n=1 Tax=Artomyces pyxidatus TaxID=48021 RepID=A0ACB8SXT7_9AGAM|nr:glycoside hydrolase family 16 protein [Artomyces pyxidatus]
MFALVSVLVLSSLSTAALAGESQGLSLRQKHQDVARQIESRSKTYHLVEKYEGADFLNPKKWNYFTSRDPTRGQVEFQSHKAATRDGLAYVDGDVAVLAVDNKHHQHHLPLGKNRNSVRITSTKKYNGGLFIADFYSMPHGCSVWPAWWSVGPNWPHAGEIDILEGVNTEETNQYTLHSGRGCKLTRSVPATAKILRTECESSNGDNAGCAFKDTDTRTFGHGFNDAGGGVYAHLWDASGIKIWHFPRDAIPADITEGRPEPMSWPTPAAFFSSEGCDISRHFYDHSLVLDTTLCGAFAGGNYAASGCPGTCEEAVANKTNFDFAQWRIHYIAVYH